MLDKLHKGICRTVGPSFAASVEPITHRWNVASLSLFYRVTTEIRKLFSSLFGQKQVFFQLFLATKYIFSQPLVTNIIYSSLIYKLIHN